MIYEMTVQVRVTNMVVAINWYRILLDRDPDFIPHEGFAEWELLPGCWLQVAEGVPAAGSGPIRLGVHSIEILREKLMNELKVESFEIYQRPEVPVNGLPLWIHGEIVLVYLSIWMKMRRMKR